MDPKHRESTQADVRALLEKRERANILAWTVLVDPFELGLRMEAFKESSPSIAILRECMVSATSRLGKLPWELIREIETFLEYPSETLFSEWKNFQECCTSTCDHRKTQLHGHRNESYKKHQRIMRDGHAKILDDPLPTPRAAGVRYSQTLKFVNDTFGIHAVIARDCHMGISPQTWLKGQVTIPIGCLNYGRDCTDAFEWISLHECGKNIDYIPNEAEKRSVREKLLAFKRALGAQALSLSDAGFEQWNSSAEWKEPTLTFFTTEQYPKGVGHPEKGRQLDWP